MKFTLGETTLKEINYPLAPEGMTGILIRSLGNKGGGKRPSPIPSFLASAPEM
jgi:hypothetical protein